MRNNNQGQDKRVVSRRDFMKTSAALSVAAVLSGAERVFAAGNDKIRIGMIGCGGRATGAMLDCFNADPNVELISMCDLFQDRIDGALNGLKENLKENFTKRVKVTPETCFTGFDGYQKLLKTDVNLIITATPPHFRPEHLRASIEAGKHVFMEKPVAVDPVGIRSVIESSELAAEKGLAIVAGTQRRHQNQYVEMMKRIHDGAIGEIVAGQCYWNMGELWLNPRQPNWSEMEYQCRNWLYYTWLSGDHIVEQHVHNIDVINWALEAMPEKCMGLGGRQVRTAPEYGHIFDHFAVDFSYPGDVRIMSMCRQSNGCADRVTERVVGTKGVAYFDSFTITGENPYKFEGDNPNPYVVEHADLLKSIRAGKPLNEGKQIAESTLCAIMGRMSAYTGKELSWNWTMKSSKLDLRPEKYELGDIPVPPVAIPGQTPLI